MKLCYYTKFNVLIEEKIITYPNDDLGDDVYSHAPTEFEGMYCVIWGGVKNSQFIIMYEYENKVWNMKTEYGCSNCACAAECKVKLSDGCDLPYPSRYIGTEEYVRERIHHMTAEVKTYTLVNLDGKLTLRPDPQPTA